MKPQDLNRIRMVSEPRVHPTLDVTVFVVKQPNLDKDRYDTSLWIADAEGARPWIKNGKAGSPAWSPDGRYLAWVEAMPDDPDGKGDDKHPQLRVQAWPPVTEPRTVTCFKLGVSSFRWSPSGDRLLVASDAPAKGWKDVASKDSGKQPRRITALPWRYDSAGTMDDTRPRLHVVDPAEQRTPLRLDDILPDKHEIIGLGDMAWNADGTRIALAISRHLPGTPIRLEDVIYELDLAKRKAVERHRDGGFDKLFYRGGKLFAMGLPGLFLWPNPGSIWEIPESGEPVNLLPSLDRSIDTMRFAGDTVFLIHEHEGRRHLVRWDGEDKVTRVLPDVNFVQDFDVRPDGTGIVFAAGGGTDPGVLYRDTKGGPERVTWLNQDFRDDITLSEPEHFVVNTGGAEVDCWVFLPQGSDKVPVLLNIHGGPATQYGFGFFDEFQVYAGAGYGVVACNPRGSSGRGADHLRAVRGEDWGEVDEQDILACLDEALKRVDRLDDKRVGVMGGSYGGFMTAWLIGRHQRFQSAIVERGLLNWPSFADISDIGNIFPGMYMDVGPEDRDILVRKSPLTYVSNVKTPTLLIHSEKDWRCPIEQAETYLAALLRQGTEAEFLRFPGESHELSRSGDPKHRKARFEAILEWHGRYLKKTAK